MPSNLPTPDIIDDGRLRQGKKLSPAAQPVGAYRAPTRDDVAEPPQDNSYSQLGRALSSMSGTMNQATAYTKADSRPTGPSSKQRAGRGTTEKECDSLHDADTNRFGSVRPFIGFSGRNSLSTHHFVKWVIIRRRLSSVIALGTRLFRAGGVVASPDIKASRQCLQASMHQLGSCSCRLASERKDEIPRSD